MLPRTLCKSRHCLWCQPSFVLTPKLPVVVFTWLTTVHATSPEERLTQNYTSVKQIEGKTNSINSLPVCSSQHTLTRPIRRRHTSQFNLSLPSRMPPCRFPAWMTYRVFVLVLCLCPPVFGPPGACTAACLLASTCISTCSTCDCSCPNSGASTRW